MRTVLLAIAAAIAAPALADFNDKKPITATVTGATPSGYPRTMVEGLNAVVRDAYPGSSVSFKPNSPGGGVLGQRVAPLGVDRFGQTGSLPDLYAAYRLDGEAITEAVAELLLPA